MRDIYMTREAIERMEEEFALKDEAVRVLALVVDEWESDPASVACFDLRIVEASRKIVNRMKVLRPEFRQVPARPAPAGSNQQEP